MSPAKAKSSPKRPVKRPAKRAAAAVPAIRPARIGDVAAICGIVNYWATRGIMLPRQEAEVLANLAEFFVLTIGGKVQSCGALASYGPQLAELRSIAVAPGSQRAGLGRKLCEFLIEKARKAKVPKVFAFTYVPGFFEKLGFRIVPPESLPQKAWKDCFRCPKREGCDEIAMSRDLI